jgi:hypothetical protein
MTPDVTAPEPRRRRRVACHIPDQGIVISTRRSLHEEEALGMTPMIEASGLVKRFGKTTALDGLDLVADRGTILAV